MPLSHPFILMLLRIERDAEADYVQQLQQLLQHVQVQKMNVDQRLASEMTSHLLKMMLKK